MAMFKSYADEQRRLDAMGEKFYAACRVVLKSAKDPYAKSYASAGLSLFGQRAIEVQCLYILNNLGSWRGEEARATKEVFRAISKGK
jgi:hypothetical protein